MTRAVLHSGQLFDPVTSSMYETEYETIVLQNAAPLFPNSHLVSFKAGIESEHGVAKADLALINRTYSAWWVIEVELSSHSLSGHVIPQIQILSTGSYERRHAVALNAALPDLDLERLRAMMKGLPPRVLVICDRYLPEWEGALAAYGVAFVSFEVYRSDMNHLAFSVQGSVPSTSQDHLSVCQRDRRIPRLVLVESPGALPFSDGDVAKIYYKDSPAAWRRVDSHSAVWLAPVGRDPLPASGPYRLVVRDGSMAFVHSDEED